MQVREVFASAAGPFESALQGLDMRSSQGAPVTGTTSVYMSRLWGVQLWRGTLLEGRPAHCSYHPRDGALGLAKGSFRKAQPGRALRVYMANKILLKMEKMTAARLWVLPLGSTADGAWSGAASREPVPAGTPEHREVPTLPTGQRPSSASRQGLPVIPISSGVAPWEAQGAGGAQ